MARSVVIVNTSQVHCLWMTHLKDSFMAHSSYSATAGSLNENDVQAINRLGELYGRLKKELGRVIIGQHDVIERLAICMFARGHGLLMGVPGLAKTLLVSKLAETMSLNFSRIQFTPDLMPMDITGTDILQDGADGKREFHFVKGPVFANIVLSDEINRAPPKTQAAMLEAMQEQKVTVVGKTFRLESPFFVLATQNPVEQEGTYPLPEAQLDRFMFLIELDYPTEAEEILIARTTTGDALPELDHLMTAAEIIEHQHLVRRIPVPDHIYQYAAKLVRKTRPQGSTAPAWLKPLVAWGAGPRAVQFLILGAKARAALHGSYMVRLEDIHEVAIPVLTHRVITTFAAQAEGLDAKQIVKRLIAETIEER
jgi:MoxR-like ATPase